MKAKNILCLFALSAAIFTACNDDDLTIYNEPLIDASSVMTGSSDVTSTSAVLHGVVKGLDGRSANSYRVGFNYMTSDQALSNVSEADLKQSVNGDIFDGNVSATLSDLMPGTVIYYQTYVTLSSTLTFKGEIKSLITTDAKVTASPASSVNAFGSTIDFAYDEVPEGSIAGITLAPVADVESVRSGLHVASGEVVTRGNASVEIKGLMPSTTYYYAPYVNVGPGEVYGEIASFTTPAYDFDLDNDLVDLGLESGLKWAKYNVGATSATDLGGLYGFGDVTGVMTSLDPADYNSGADVAAVAYSNKATLPTAADWEELFNSCKLEWTSDNGVEGFKVTGPNGNSIFLPAAGSRTMSDISGAGSKGYYLTKTGGSDSKYYTAYEFASSNAYGRTVLPVYQAVSARAVSTSRDVKLNEEYLLNTWEFDFNNGTSQYFVGPVYFYGTDDSWDSITNNIPATGDSWSWEADAGNNWIWGDNANLQGSMTFSIDEEGNRIVEVKQYTGNGTYSNQKGTYTLDKDNKTITLSGCEILVPANYLGDATQSRSDRVKILSLTADGLQLGVVRTDDPCLLGMNYIPQLKKYGYTASLTCYGDWNDEHWNETAEITIPSGDAGLGEHTLVLNTTNPRQNGMVYIIDIDGYANDYPNALITVESIKADGKEIPFDANKLFYGNIEGNGKYRLELANIWGCGHNDGWNGLADSPYRQGGGEVEGGEPNLAFNTTFEVTFNIRALDASSDIYFPTLVTINPDWGGSWDWNDGSNFAIKLNEGTHQWEVTQPEQSIKITTADSGADMSKGSIMTFVQINNLYKLFPGIHASLKDIKIDGTSLTGWDPAKVLDVSADGEGVHYRLELFNTYSATKGNCAFGQEVDDFYIPALGFNDSMQLDYTIERLFAIPSWN
ncbi:MAG: fibronectin type III domain-containing protein [Muribaculaceae bacterium]|nr:fibronectin type III domain-containing protein [Muribaculaceae bacterium]